MIHPEVGPKEKIKRGQIKLTEARSSKSDPSNEPRQPALGCSSHSRRTLETRLSDITRNGRQVHGPPQEATFAVVASHPQEPRNGFGLCRFLRRPNDCVPTPIRLRDSRP